ncbi:MAG TPA: L-lactate permease [Nocardioidaceae bacterium]|nr:L-lactate permease [Nocardioidaceae bacterium]
MTLPVTPWHWLAAVAPVIALFVLVTSGRVKTRTASVLVAGLTALLAFAVFGAGVSTLGVAFGKGLWLGSWILYVVFPAMLLYRIAERGGLDRIGELFQHLFPNRSENLLVLAWLLPSFVQGVAGFGTPIAVAAPLLAASGWRRERAVAYPLIGYHWSVTFGSMGSSYYMAELTAHLSPSAGTVFAHHAALLLGVNCLVAGALVLLFDGGVRGLRDGVPLLLVSGVPMAATLYGVTSVVPAVGSVAAGAVGFACALGLSAVTRLRGKAVVSAPAVSAASVVEETELARPSSAGGSGGAAVATLEPPGDDAASRRRAVWLVSPYLYLLGIALLVLLIPPTRAWAESHLVWGPSFPATTTGLGWRAPAVSGYTPLKLLTHPGSYLLLACLLGYLTYRAVGLWRHRPAVELAKAWLSSVQSTAISIVALACVTDVMIDSGMISTLARGVVAATGAGYPALSGLIGGLGSFLTGSTTSSNALLASLQAEVAGLLHVPATVLLAAQTAGANVGNSVAPVVVLIGISAVGGGFRPQAVLRLVLVAAGVLMAVVTALTLALVWLV